MIPVRTYDGERVAVFGMGKSGLATVRALVSGGALVEAWDDAEAGQALAAKAGAKTLPPEQWTWSEIRAVVLAPGVPLTHPKPHPVVERARAAGVAVIGDVELFAYAIEHADPRPYVVAITGTNGKSTTTALTAHLLERCGFDVKMGGNIGRPVLDLDPPGARTAYVLEISSFQIDLTRCLQLDGAALLNITPDHLDRHGTLEHYAAVKARIFDFLRPDGTAVIGVDDAHCEAICTRVRARRPNQVVPVAVGRALGTGMYVIGGILFDGTESQCVQVKNLNGLTGLPGAHNWQNAAVAYALAHGLGADASSVDAAFETFPGLPHRLETVDLRDGVRFVNDSKATNSEATAKALLAYDKSYWILGGRAKTDGIEGLEPLFPRVAKAYLIGEASERFAATLEGRVPFERCGTLDVAVAAAARDAAAAREREAVVLFSPACASFDQFTNFEARGDAFRSLVAQVALPPRGRAQTPLSISEVHP